jgi:hypothetical protein
METKKTIAILGLTEEAGNLFLSKLAQYCRLLIVSDHSKNPIKPSDFIKENETEPCIEVVDCAKDGCWEADIIMLLDGFQRETEELQKLEAVATQKIILILTEQEKSTPNPSLFPHSKVITLFKNPVTTGAKIIGTDIEALQTITELINKTDFYQLTEK